MRVHTRQPGQPGPAALQPPVSPPTPAHHRGLRNNFANRRSPCSPVLAASRCCATDANANSLVKAVVADFSASEGRSAARDGLKAEFAGGKPADIKAKSIDSLRQVSSLLAAKATGDAAAFKGWLRQISQSTAEAATEGGSLFGGGVQVSDAEKATLGEISNALGV